MNLLDNAVIYLIDKEPFFGYFLVNCIKKVDNSIKTAGVCVKDKVNIVFNENFFKTLTLPQQAAVLKHEVLHVIVNHFARFEKLGDKLNFPVMNMAADIAINQMVPEIPKEFLMDGRQAQSACIENLLEQYPNAKRNETFEYYYEFLKQNLPKQEILTIDDHNKMQEGEQSPDFVEGIVRQTIKDALENIKQTGSSLGSSEELLIKDFLTSKISWKQLLRNFISNANETFQIKTRKKRNKRYGLVFPGTKKERKLNIIVATDVSGSISEEQRSQFFKEIELISKNNVCIKVLTCDTKINDVFEYNPKKLPKIHGGGGTLYNPVMEYVKNDKNCDALIFFGDMDCFDETNILNPKVPVLWAITGKQEPPAKFGRKIYIDGK